MELKEPERTPCGGCGREIAADETIVAGGIPLCVACARETGYLRGWGLPPWGVLLAGALLVAGMALPWAPGSVVPGVDLNSPLRWLIGASGLLLAALSGLRGERDHGLFLLGPIALLAALLLWAFSLQIGLGPRGEAPPLTEPGLLATAAGLVVLALALWRAPGRRKAPARAEPHKGE